MLDRRALITPGTRARLGAAQRFASVCAGESTVTVLDDDGSAFLPLLVRCDAGPMRGVETWMALESIVAIMPTPEGGEDEGGQGLAQRRGVAKKKSRNSGSLSNSGAARERPAQPEPLVAPAPALSPQPQPSMPGPSAAAVVSASQSQVPQTLASSAAQELIAPSEASAAAAAAAAAAAEFGDGLPTLVLLSTIAFVYAMPSSTKC
jgi:hypothetical protein